MNPTGKVVEHVVILTGHSGKWNYADGHRSSSTNLENHLPEQLTVRRVRPTIAKPGKALFAFPIMRFTSAIVIWRLSAG